MPNILENGSSPCKENRQVQNEGNSQALLKSANTDLVQDSHEVSGTLQSDLFEEVETVPSLNNQIEIDKSSTPVTDHSPSAIEKPVRPCHQQDLLNGKSRQSRKERLIKYNIELLHDDSEEIRNLKSTVVDLDKTCDKMMKENATNLQIIRDLEKQNKLMSEELENRKSSPLLESLVQEHLKNLTRDPRGYRYTRENKLFSLNAYRRGPACYGFLQNNLTTSMPTKRTLQREAKKSRMHAGLDDDLLEAIKKEAEKMDPLDRFCALSFDEIGLKERLFYCPETGKVVGFADYGDDVPDENTNDVANKALVFMIRGLRKPWKQPLLFYFNRGGIDSCLLKKIILKVIDAVNETGLRVRCVVADQAGANCSALNELVGYDSRRNRGRDDDLLEPSFFYVTVQSTGEQVKVYVLFDWPHLGKCIRNNWMGNYDKWKKQNPNATEYEYPGNQIIFNGKTGYWRDVVLLWDWHTVSRTFRINKTMMILGSRGKMRVCHFVKVVSNTSATEMLQDGFLKFFNMRMKSINDKINCCEKRKNCETEDENWELEKVVVIQKKGEENNNTSDNNNAGYVDDYYDDYDDDYDDDGDEEVEENDDIEDSDEKKNQEAVDGEGKNKKNIINWYDPADFTGLATASILASLDEVFDLGNGPAKDEKKDKQKETRSHFTRGCDKANKMREWAKKINMIKFKTWDGNETRPPCVANMARTLVTLAALWEDLEADGYEMLNLRHVNQDCLEGWFSKVRQGSGANNNPTVIDFERIFGACLIKEKKECQVKGANCESGGGFILVSIETVERVRNIKKKKSINQTLEVDDEDMNSPSPPCFHIPDYDSGVEDKILEAVRDSPSLLRDQIRCSLIKHVPYPCESCKSNFIKSLNLSSSSSTSPLDYTIERATSIFNEKIRNNLHIPNILEATLIYFEEIKMSWLDCKDHRLDMRKNIINIITRVLIDMECYVRNSPIIHADAVASNAAKVSQLAKQKKTPASRKQKGQENKTQLMVQKTQNKKGLTTPKQTTNTERQLKFLNTPNTILQQPQVAGIVSNFQKPVHPFQLVQNNQSLSTPQQFSNIQQQLKFLKIPQQQQQQQQSKFLGIPNEIPQHHHHHHHHHHQIQQPQVIKIGSNTQHPTETAVKVVQKIQTHKRPLTTQQQQQQQQQKQQPKLLGIQNKIPPQHHQIPNPQVTKIIPNIQQQQRVIQKMQTQIKPLLPQQQQPAFLSTLNKVPQQHHHHHHIQQGQAQDVKIIPNIQQQQQRVIQKIQTQIKPLIPQQQQPAFLSTLNKVQAQDIKITSSYRQPMKQVQNIQGSN